jgi:predicted type IV restriction endonuclease
MAIVYTPEYANQSTSTSTVDLSAESAVVQDQGVTGNETIGKASAVNTDEVMKTATYGYSIGKSPLIVDNLETYVVTDVSGIIDDYNNAFTKLYKKINDAIDSNDLETLGKYVYYTSGS